MMMRFRWFFIYVLCAALRNADAHGSSSTTWHRLGLGRTIHVLNHDSATSNIIVVTSLATVASIDIETSAIRWRIPAPISKANSPVRPLALTSLQSPLPPLLLILLSDETVRAIDVVKAAAVWHVSACRLGLTQESSVPIQTCDDRILWLNPFNGLPTDSIPAKSSFHTLPDLPSASPELQWSLAKHVLISATDGTLRLLHDKRQVWQREDGIAHASAGSIFILQQTSIVVILSDLGALYALGDGGSLQWKLPVGRRCILLDGLPDCAVVVCIYDDSTHVRAVRVADGTVVFTKSISNFRAERAAIDQCCGDQICVVTVDNAGNEQWLTQCDLALHTSTVPTSRGWIFYSEGGRDIRGIRGGATTWRVAMPSASTIAAVVTTRLPHASSSRLRPPPYRVTGSRKLLRKHVNEDTILVLAHDNNEAGLYAMIIDSSTGSVHDVFNHKVAHAPIAGVRGDNWFVYTFWNSVMLQQEVHVVDMYNRPRNGSWVGGTVRAAVRALFGPELMSAFGIPDPDFSISCQPSNEDEPDALQCPSRATFTQPSAPPIPVLMRSSSLLSHRVVGLDVTETAMGITESAIIMILESGQVSLVPKFFLDAYVPDVVASQGRAKTPPQYEAVLYLQSSAGKSVYFAEGVHIPGIKQIAVAPSRERESTTEIAVFGLDVVYSTMQPVGSFDALPADFLYSAVVAMIVFLAGGVIYSHRLKTRLSLTKSW